MRPGCKDEAKLTVPDSVLRKEEIHELVSEYCNGSDDGSYRGHGHHAIRRGRARARRAILGAENDEPASVSGADNGRPGPILWAGNEQPRPILMASNDQPLPIRGGDNGQPSSILTAENDESRQARAEDCDKVHHQTVGHPAHTKAIPSGCDGSLGARCQDAPSGSAGQHE